MKKIKLKNVVRRFDVSNIIIQRLSRTNLTVKCFGLIIYPNKQLRNQSYSNRECSYLN